MQEIFTMKKAQVLIFLFPYSYYPRDGGEGEAFGLTICKCDLLFYCFVLFMHDLHYLLQLAG